MNDILNRTAESQVRTEGWSGTELEFPSARYFQIHFEHLHSVVAELRREVFLLKRELLHLRAATDGESPPSKRLSS
jgi:hypothetical protein